MYKQSSLLAIGGTINPTAVPFVLNNNIGLQWKDTVAVAQTVLILDASDIVTLASIANNLVLNAPATKQITFQNAGANRVRIKDGLTLYNDMRLFWIDSGGTARVVLNLGTTNILVLQNDAAEQIDIKTDNATGAGNLVTRMTFLKGALVGAAGIEVYEPLIFTAAMTVTTTKSMIYTATSNGSLNYNIPTSFSHFFKINGSSRLVISNTTFNISNNVIITMNDSGGAARPLLVLNGSNIVILSNDAAGVVRIQTDNATGVGNLITRIEFGNGGAVGASPILLYEKLDFKTLTQGTVGATGAASVLPAFPTGYVKIKVDATDMVIPYYAAA